MSKLLLQMVVIALVPCLLAGPIVSSIPPSGCSLPGSEEISAECPVQKEALSPVLASARIPFNHVKSALVNSLKAFGYRQGNWFGWPLQAGHAHAADDAYQWEFDRGNSQNSIGPSLRKRLARTFFAKKRSEGSGGTETPDINQRILRLLRGFLSDPEHGDQFAEELKTTLDKESQFDIELGRKLVMRAMPRIQVPVAKAIAILEKGGGKGAVMKLPLGLEDLKAVINSPAERSLTLFRSGSARFLLVYPGSAGQMEVDRPMLSYPSAPGPGFSMFATALGHSHPRFTGAQPSEPDLIRDITTDTFILALVDMETIEVTLWRANERDYRTERGPEVFKFLVYLGLLAPQKHTTLLSPLRLSLIAYLFVFGSLMADSNHLLRSVGLIVTGEKQPETTTPHPTLLPRAA